MKPTDPEQVSTSALIAAFVRAHHAIHDNPKIFADNLAIKLFTEDEKATFSRNLAEALKFFDPERAALCPDPESTLAASMRAQSGPITLTRARYTEDALEVAMGQGVRRLQEATRRSGEPMITGFDPASLPGSLAAVGLRLIENLSPAGLEARYFANRSDGFHAFEHIHFGRAQVA